MGIVSSRKAGLSVIGNSRSNINMAWDLKSDQDSSGNGKPIYDMTEVQDPA